MPNLNYPMDCLGDLELENIYLLRHAGLTHVIITKGQASKLKYEKAFFISL